MDNFETTYDVEEDYIQCTVCEKSIRGETLYKIHLTTPGHLKKEEVSVASGNPGTKSTLPEFKDILQYLDYLQLNEPIIGLDELSEVPSQDAQGSPNYSCKLCNVLSSMMEMVHHLIGRKHRQKYVEKTRRDLVTWDSESVLNQSAKFIRAKAEIIERQDGRGNPVLLPKLGPQNKSRVPPSQRPNTNQNYPNKYPQQNVPSIFPERRGYVDKYSTDQERYTPRSTRTSPFHQGRANTDRGRQIYQQEDRYVEDERYSADVRGNDDYRPEYNDTNDVMYGEKYVVDPHRRDQPHDHTHRRSQPHDFYSDEVGRRKTGSPYESPPLPYPQNERQRSLDREPGRHDAMGRASRSGSCASETGWGSAPAAGEESQSHSRLLKIIKDYQHKKQDSFEEEAIPYPGPSRTGPASSQRLGDITKTISGIPEPFRRFLTGATNEEELGRRKRKSRFSDATAEEVERTKRMFRDEYGPTNPTYSGHPRADGAPRRPEIHEIEHSNLYTQSQSPQHSGSYYRESLGSDGVFDLLNGIEIENTEDADFLKTKLCSLLREFKTKKEQSKNSQVGVVSSLKQHQQPLPPRQQYERSFSPDSDLRQPLDTSFRGDFRGRGWEQHKYMPEEQPQDYHHSVSREPGPSNRTHFEETTRHPGMSRMHQEVPFSAEPKYYSEKFQEPIHSRDYRHSTQEYFDSTPRPGRMDEEPKMQSSFRYSKNLEKITSTLLEFVARKQ